MSTTLTSDDLAARAATALTAKRFNLDNIEGNVDNDGPILVMHHGGTDAFAYRVFSMDAASDLLAGEIADAVADPGDITVIDLRDGSTFAPIIKVEFDNDGTFTF